MPTDTRKTEMIHLKEYFCPIVALCVLVFTAPVFGGCDVTIRSTAESSKVQEFTSPNWPSNYGNNLICLYKFIGLPDERVYLNFTYLDVKGIPPRCRHDYIDVYTVINNENQLDDLLQVPVYGRYCGSFVEEVPHLIVSMHNIIVVGLFSDDDKSATGFKGFVEFVRDDMYNMGAAEPANVCGYTINSVSRPNGSIVAPTYPGVYPDNIFCYYKLTGLPGQRIRLEFVDFDMFEGGEHCPYDSVSIYDGHTNESELIAVLCGKQTGLVIFSSYETLHIEFRTKSGRPETEKKEYLTYWELDPDYDIKRRGFKANYEFSDRFVDLRTFIKGDSVHIPGTECDQHVTSKSESNGSLTSPNFPGLYPLDTMCYYYLDGLMNSQTLEKVRLTFHKLDIPKFDKCSNVRVSLYMRGTDPASSSATKVICGSALPDNLVSTSPRLVLVFNSIGGTIAGVGFNVSYNFIKDYAIPGTPLNDDECHFLYSSSQRKLGSFNSPRHPAQYPNNVDCIFELRAMPGEKTIISFGGFELYGIASSCVGDWLEVYNVFTDPSNHSLTVDVFFKRYCGAIIPGPISSTHNAIGLKVLFHSNNDSSTAKGFKANYQFKESSAGVCGEELNKGIGGVIHSLNYPEKYSPGMECTWTITGVRPLHQVMLQFTTFDVEKVASEDLDLICQNAVLRVYTSGKQTPDYELCGGMQDLNNSMALMLKSSDNEIRISFTTSTAAQGKKGFEISWTEILRNRFDYCNDFTCKQSKLCISQNLTCNGYPNCGLGDTSDEMADCPQESNFNALHLVLGCVVTILIILIVVVCIWHHHRKRTHQRQAQHAPLPLRLETRKSYHDVESIDEKLDKMLIRDKIPKVSAV